MAEPLVTPRQNEVESDSSPALYAGQQTRRLADYQGLEMQ